MNNALDLVFKKIVNRVYSSANKTWYEELSGDAFLLNSKKIWSEDIPSIPPVVDTTAIKVYTALSLVEDITVNNKQAWQAEDPVNTRVKGFISPLYGQEYTVRLYDGLSNEIPTTDASNWFFDYESGVLSFENNPAVSGWDISGMSVKVYRYIGKTVHEELIELANQVGSQTILGLTDTPNSYTGVAGKSLRVNATEDGVEFISEILNNYSGLGAPTINNDINEGYSIGSMWIDTVTSPRDAYRCIDATPLNAVWLLTTLSADEVNTITFLSLTDSPVAYTGKSGMLVRVNAGENGVEFVDIGGIAVFTDLGDTPSNYTGHAGKTLRVTGVESGVEFVDTIDNIIELTDTPPSYISSIDFDSGGVGLSAAHHVMKVNATNNAIEFSKIFLKELADGPGEYLGQANKILKVLPDESGIFFGLDKSGSFFDLNDTPTDYIGASGKIVIVNPSEDGLLFLANKFTNIDDTPPNYISAANKILQVNATEDGIQYASNSLNMMSDYPVSYVGQADKVLAVKTDESGLEFLGVVTEVLNPPAPAGGLAGNTAMITLGSDWNMVFGVPIPFSVFSGNSDAFTFYAPEGRIKLFAGRTYILQANMMPTRNDAQWRIYNRTESVYIGTTGQIGQSIIPRAQKIQTVAQAIVVPSIDIWVDVRIIGGNTFNGEQLITADNSYFTVLEFARFIEDVSGSTELSSQIVSAATQNVLDITDTLLTFDTEVFDTTNMFELASPTKLTIGTSGRYFIQGYAEFAINSTGIRKLTIMKNGLPVYSSTENAVTGTVTPVSISAVLDLISTDYIEIRAYQNSGVSLSIVGGASTPMISAIEFQSSDVSRPQTFANLTDTPVAYAGNGGKVAAVRGTEDGIEFIDVVTTFTGLSDTPAAFDGLGGDRDKLVKVNAVGNALVFSNFNYTTQDIVGMPTLLTGQVGMTLKVNTAEDGYELLPDDAFAGPANFLELPDTPNIFPTKPYYLTNPLAPEQTHILRVQYGSNSGSGAPGQNLIWGVERDRLELMSDTPALEYNPTTGHGHYASAYDNHVLVYNYTNNNWEFKAYQVYSFLQLTDTPNDLTNQIGKLLFVDGDVQTGNFSNINVIDPNAIGRTEFKNLDDTPVSFTGQARKLLSVNDTENGLQYTQQPPYNTNFLGFQAYLSTSISLSSSTLTTLLFDNVPYDTVSMYSPATGKYTIANEGYWAISIQASTIGTFESGELKLGIRVDGSDVIYQIDDNTSNASPSLHFMTTLPLLVGQEVEVVVYQASGVSRAILGNIVRSTFFQMHLLQSAGIENEKPHKQIVVGTDANNVDMGMGVTTNLDTTFKLMFELDNAGVSPFDLSLFVNDITIDSQYQTIKQITAAALISSANLDNSTIAIVPASANVTGEATIHIRTDGKMDVSSTVIVNSGTSGIERHEFSITTEFSIASILKLSFKCSTVTNDIKAGSVFKLYKYAQGTTSGIGTFKDLFDTPSNYAGAAGYNAVVKADLSGLEFRPERTTFPENNDVAPYPPKDGGFIGDQRYNLDSWIPYVTYNQLDASISYMADKDIFLKLGDTPNVSNYILRDGNNQIIYDVSGMIVKVKGDGSGLDFFDEIDVFTELHDTPIDYINHRGKLLRVKGDESGIEFVDPTSGDLLYVGCKVSKTSTLLHGNGTTIKIEFDSEVYDTDQMFDEVAITPTKIVIHESAKYLINARVGWEINSSGTRTVRILKNGIDVISETTVEPYSTIPTEVNISVQDVFIEGDYFEIEAYQDSGIDLNLSITGDGPMAEISRLGGALSGGYTSLTVSALTGDLSFDMIDAAPGDIFDMVIDIENPTGIKADLALYVNEDFTNSEYINVRIYANGTDVITDRTNTPRICPVNANTKSTCNVTFRRTSQGYFDILATSVYKSGNTAVDHQSNTITYRTIIPKIRKLNLRTLSGASGVPFDGIGIGTTVKIFKKGSVNVNDAVGSSISSILDLSDTPVTYSGSANKILAVNVFEDAMEFVELPNKDTLTKLNDTPTSYVGQAYKFLVVNGTEDGVEFIQPGTSVTPYTEYYAQFNAIGDPDDAYKRRVYYKATSSQVSTDTVIFLQADFGGIDVSRKEHLMLSSGSTVAIGNHPFGFEKAFNSTLIAQDHNDWYWNDDSYTIDFWAYPMSYAVSNIPGLPANVSSIAFHQTDTFGVGLDYVGYFGSDGLFRVVIDAGKTLTGLNIIDQYTWHHIAIVFNKLLETLTLYVDGVLEAQATGVITGNINPVYPLYILGDGTKAFIDMFRMSKGVALWNANFDPTIDAASSIDGRLFIKGTAGIDDKVAIYRDIEEGIVPVNIGYTNTDAPSINNLQEALDMLLYINPDITSFVNSINTVEVGNTVTDVTLDWVINKTILTQSIDQGVGAIDALLRTKSLIGLLLTTDTTFTLTVADDQNNSTLGTSVLFRHKRYWGTNVSSILSDIDILALSSEFHTSRVQTRTFDCTGGKYFYLAYPTVWGSASFKVGGLSFTDVNLVQRTFVNASGHSEQYNIYRPNNIQTGSNIIVEVS